MSDYDKKPSKTSQDDKANVAYLHAPIVDGLTSITFTSWRFFADFVTQDFLEYNSYIYRGQSNSAWLLEPSLDRLLKMLPPETNHEKVIFRHLGAFIQAVRGRRGLNPPKIETEDDWWALGQHHGLATPLLDWTKSPFVAAFFAYATVDPTTVEYVAIFALHVPSIRLKSDHLRLHYIAEEGKRPPGIFFISPFSDENPRLINQAALFTRTPFRTDLEFWVKTNFHDELKEAKIIKMLVPASERDMVLKALNRMNINHLSLFPDLTGASQFCNLAMTLEKYEFV